MEKSKAPDLAREMFNPVRTRADYRFRGFSPAFIETLVELDTLIYNSPPEEIRAAVDARMKAQCSQ
jgi:hypothetical protein